MAYLAGMMYVLKFYKHTHFRAKATPEQETPSLRHRYTVWETIQNALFMEDPQSTEIG